MKKLLFGLIATVMVGMSVNANSLGEEIKTPPKSQSTEDVRVKISIHIVWGRKSRKCEGFGICAVTIEIDPGIDISNWSFKGSSNTDGKLLLDISAAEMQNVRKLYGSDTIVIEEDFRLSDEVCKSLELKTGYTVKAGNYRVSKTSTGDYSIVL